MGCQLFLAVFYPFQQLLSLSLPFFSIHTSRHCHLFVRVSAFGRIVFVSFTIIPYYLRCRARRFHFPAPVLILSALGCIVSIPLRPSSGTHLAGSRCLPALNVRMRPGPVPPAISTATSELLRLFSALRTPWAYPRSRGLPLLTTEPQNILLSIAMYYSGARPGAGVESLCCNTRRRNHDTIARARWLTYFNLS